MGADPMAAAAPAEGAAPPNISGPGWVIQLTGYHFHNNNPRKPSQQPVEFEGKQFIETTFFENLENATVRLPDGPTGELVEVPIAELGIRCPVVVTKARIEDAKYLTEPGSTEDGGRGTGGRTVFSSGGRGGGDSSDGASSKTWNLRQYDFVIQFCWQPKPRGQRREEWAQQGREFPETASLDEAGAVARGDSS
jgi:hypothetical protein